MTLLVAVLASLALLAPPAGAHAFLTAQFPTDGQILDSSADPTSVAYDYNEAVTVDPGGFAIRDAAGTLVSGPASAGADAPDRVGVTSSAPLAPGRYALETSVTSKDGHQLVTAYGFAVGPEPSAGAPTAVALELAPVAADGAPLAVSVDASAPGSRTVTVPVPQGVTGGQVRLTCRRGAGDRVPKVRAPFLWKLGDPAGGVATATGYLPVPCAYTVRIVLERAFPASPSSYVTSPDHALAIAG